LEDAKGSGFEIGTTVHILIDGVDCIGQVAKISPKGLLVKFNTGVEKKYEDVAKLVIDVDLAAAKADAEEVGEQEAERLQKERADKRQQQTQERINVSTEGVEEVGNTEQMESGTLVEDGSINDPTLPTLSAVVKSAIEFEPGNPTGTYVLDIDQPFERAIAYLILELANKFPGFEL
jgi:hypothetical protein